MTDIIDTAQEEWRPVKGYEGLYSVSNLGRVRREISVGCKTPRFIVIKIDRWGYRTCRLNKNAYEHTKIIHKLIAEAFIGPPPEGKPQINHKDGNKLNNFPDNLEWTNQSENMLHAYRVLGHKHSCGEKHYQAKLSDKEVLEIVRLHSAGVKTCVIARIFNIDDATVYCIVTGRNWTHVTGLKRITHIKQLVLAADRHV